MDDIGPEDADAFNDSSGRKQPRQTENGYCQGKLLT